VGINRLAVGACFYIVPCEGSTARFEKPEEDKHNRQLLATSKLDTAGKLKTRSIYISALFCWASVVYLLQTQLDGRILGGYVGSPLQKQTR
jgi:hypothetical protein